MGRSSLGGRLGRLGELQGLLRARDYWTVADLAGELGVSARTVFRDLQILRETGQPIDADRGRGGGLRIDSSAAAARLSLGWLEAIDLLLALAIAEKIGSPLLLSRLTAIKRKVAASLSGEQAARMRALRRRILLGRPASVQVMQNYAAPKSAGLAAIAQAFFEQRRLAIAYVDGKNAPSQRVIEPQFLYFNIPVWYVLGWDLSRLAPRTFRIDRIRSADMREGRFRLRDSASFLAQAEHDARHL